jgi:hypothetical protein
MVAKPVISSLLRGYEKDELNDMAHYGDRNFIKNRLDALLKPIVGINHGRNAPGY